MNPGLDAQQVSWYPRDMVAGMEQDRTRAAQLMLRDIDKAGPDGDRWFLASTSVEGLPMRDGYYLGYLFAKSEGGGQSLPQLARMAPEQIHQEAVTFLTQLAHAGGVEGVSRIRTSANPPHPIVTEPRRSGAPPRYRRLDARPFEDGSVDKTGHRSPDQWEDPEKPELPDPPVPDE
jgi:hypothetical protein